MKILRHRIYKEMFWVVWPNGSVSDDFYNKIRANNFCKVLEENERLHQQQKAREIALEARGCV